MNQLVPIIWPPWAHWSDSHCPTEIPGTYSQQGPKTGTILPISHSLFTSADKHVHMGLCPNLGSWDFTPAFAQSESRCWREERRGAAVVAAVHEAPCLSSHTSKVGPWSWSRCRIHNTALWATNTEQHLSHGKLFEVIGFWGICFWTTMEPQKNKRIHRGRQMKKLDL